MDRLAEHSYVPVRLQALVPGLPLPFDLYMSDTPIPRLILKKGEAVSEERLKRLKKLAATSNRQFLVPEFLRDQYSRLIWYGQNDHLKARFIHSSMLIQVKELFSRNDTFFVVQGAKALVEKMVRLVNDDPAAVKSLLRLSLHDQYTYRHSVNVAVYSIAIARYLNGGNPDFLVKVGMGGLLHDIGKRRIHEKVINKTGKLSDQEWIEIKRHPLYGENFVLGIPSLPKEIADVVKEHHENFDGSGYPFGLKGSEILELTRIVSVADVFDALTTNRSYQKAVSPPEAFRIMFSLQPGKFDATVLSCFYRYLYRKKRVHFDGADTFDPCDP